MVETPEIGGVGESPSDATAKIAEEARERAAEELRRKEVAAKALLWRAETYKDVVVKKRVLAEELAEAKEVQAKAVYADTLRRKKETENEANWLIAKAGGKLS